MILVNTRQPKFTMSWLIIGGYAVCETRAMSDVKGNGPRNDKANPTAAWTGNPRPLDRAALARYLQLWQCEVDALVDRDRQRLIACLQSLLRIERQRGISGHWTYDIARHRLLRDSLKHLQRSSL